MWISLCTDLNKMSRKGYICSKSTAMKMKSRTSRPTERLHQPASTLSTFYRRRLCRMNVVATSYTYCWWYYIQPLLHCHWCKICDIMITFLQSTHSYWKEQEVCPPYEKFQNISRVHKQDRLMSPYKMDPRDNPFSYRNSSSVHFKKPELHMWVDLSFVKTDIYRMLRCSSTGVTKVNERVSVFKELTVHCWRHRWKRKLAPRTQELERDWLYLNL